MKISYRALRNTAIAFALITLCWIIVDTIQNYERKSPLYYSANKAFLNKSYTDSLLLYERLYEKEPSNLFALEGMARSLGRLGRFQESEKIFLTVIAITNKITKATIGI